MNELANDIKNSREIKLNSANTYAKNITKIYKEVFDEEYDKANINKLKKFQIIKKYLSTLPIYTQKNLVVAIMVTIKSYKFPKYVIKKYEDYFYELTTKINNNYKTHKQSNKDKTNWVSDDYIEKVESKLKQNIKPVYHYLDDTTTKPLKNKDIDAFQQYVVFSLYTKMPPLRNNYVNTIVITKSSSPTNTKKMLNDKTYNYIDLNDNKLYLYNYKTHKTYGDKILPMEDEVIDIITDWMKINPSKYLLINVTNKTPMKSNGLTKYLNKIFKPKKVSTTLLRKYYLSHKYPVNPELEDSKRKDANMMGHSVNTQQKIYRKMVNNHTIV